MGISSRRHRNGEGAPEGERRLVQMGRIPDADERHTRRLYGAPADWMARAARTRTRPPNDRGGTHRIVVGSPNPRAIGVDGAASKAMAARLAASLSAASARDGSQTDLRAAFANGPSQASPRRCAHPSILPFNGSVASIAGYAASTARPALRFAIPHEAETWGASRLAETSGCG